MKWEKVFKNGPSKICGRQPLKHLSLPFKFFKGSLSQILLGPFLNTLSQMVLLPCNIIDKTVKKKKRSERESYQ